MRPLKWITLLPACVLLVVAATVADDLGYTGSASFIGTQIATTYWDRQHPASVGRMIAQDQPDSIHFIWTHLSSAGGIPEIHYQFMRYENGYGWSPSFGTNGRQVASYHASGANLVAFQNKGAPVYHGGASPSYRPSDFAIDFLPGFGMWYWVDIPEDNCPYIMTGYYEYGYSWPKIAVDAYSTPDPIYHVITTEGYGSGGQMLSLVYFRGVGSPPAFGPCGAFIDSVLTTSAIICQDPTSDRVAIIYLRPRNKDASTASIADNDVVYVVSNDQGATWGSKINITDYLNTNGLRAYPDLTAMYTTDGILHIAWIAAYFNHITQTFADQKCKLKHWDTGSFFSSTVTVADNVQSCTPGAGMLNIAKPCLSQCNGKLYITYARFSGSFNAGTEDCSAGGYANGDLHIKVSETGGYTWGPAVNISDTRTDGCTPDNCGSENWPSAVEWCQDSLRIFYVGDTDAGAYADGGNEGTETACPMMFRSVPCFAMAPFIELVAEPGDFSAEPFELDESGSADTIFVISNRGNTTANCILYIEYLTGTPGWLSVSPTSTSIQPQVPREFELLVVSPGEGEFTARIGVQYSPTETIYIPVSLNTASYVPGDASGDGAVDITNAVYLIAYIFSGGAAPDPLLAGDANCDTVDDISDVVYLIAYIFSGGSAPCEGH